MNRSRELPLIDPVYSTYHRQGSASAIIVSNPSIRNWYLNNSVMLRCNRKFLHGFTTPEISVCKSNLTDNPYIHKTVIPMQYLNGYVHFVIREILNRGDYVYFDKLDDFYIKGKTWSGIRHFTHDGLISGYDLDKNTYTLFAYDSDWRYRSFIVNKDDIEKARRAVFKNNEYGSIIALKPDDKIIELDPRTIIIKLREHITSDIQKFPPVGDDTVYGIVVHEYIAKYLDMLIDQSIPYEKTLNIETKNLVIFLPVVKKTRSKKVAIIRNIIAPISRN